MFDWLSKSDAIQLLELIEAARVCSSIKEINCLFEGLNSLLSFDMAVCGVVQFDDFGMMKSQRIVNVSYPDEWFRLYQEREFASVDSVVISHMKEFKSQNWCEAYEKIGRNKDFVSLADDFGLEDGYSFGSLSPQDKTATIFSLSNSKNDRPHTVEILDIVAPHFLEALRRVVLQELHQLVQPLTPRELEVVQWIANGKSSWEISKILNISERTVKFHTSTIIQKLGASNRTHAVAKSLSYGLISLDA